MWSACISIQAFFVYYSMTISLSKLKRLFTRVQTLENASTTAAATAPKRWVGLISQSGTNAPTTIVLKNELGGDLVWTYDVVGNYYATLVGGFTINKTLVMIHPSSSARRFGASSWEDGDHISVDTQSSSGVDANNMLNYTPLVIEVYP